MVFTHTEIIVAARGWSHPRWNEGFYPDDLPEDWRLSYYSNEFRAVVVPASQWITVDPIELERWVEDAHEEFRFFLEVETLSSDWNGLSQRAGLFRQQLSGILLRPMALDNDLSLIADDLDAATALAPTALLLPDKTQPTAAGLGLLLKRGVELCWEPKAGREKPHWRGDQGLATVRITGEMNYTPRQWRETIETVLRYAGNHRTVLVMVDKAAPDVEEMRTAVMIGDLLTAPPVD